MRANTISLIFPGVFLLGIAAIPVDDPSPHELQYPGLGSEDEMHPSRISHMRRRLITATQSKNIGAVFCLQNSPIRGLSDTTFWRSVNPWIKAQSKRETDLCEVAPHSCTTIKCNEGNTIFICSDNDEIIRPVCSDLALYLQKIVDECSIYVKGAGVKTRRVGGQVFDDRGFNVVMGYSKDCLEVSAP
ncbi:hypothetical protein GLAREA_05892 [Glarea lozoyensis ATCC 20868]|uniref:Uncharacterized protein n=1 Tax=Glarea lozoyensis (strain ATCC 20868 / MF5171) TaxID=1116229 RepID=S3D529_GLAL2|nr:uncharacterized protein GLAREA_05892 [Glarea lozoyensis ATCC 20868]EPE32880.1 hypothetical protein GLAREA_05892 [Glarea lozoyensis ATCC 20868]